MKIGSIFYCITKKKKMKNYINKVLSGLKRELNRQPLGASILIALCVSLIIILCGILLYLFFVAIFHDFKTFLLFISPFVIISLGVYYLKKYLNSRDDL